MIFARARPGVVQESPPDEPLQSLTDAAVSMTDSGDIGDQEPLAVMDLLATIETPGAASAILRAMRGLDPRPGALQAMAQAFDEIRGKLVELATDVILAEADDSQQDAAEYAESHNGHR